MLAHHHNPDPKTGPGLELLLLHALPLDGSMWAEQMHLLPGSTYAPTLYPFGENIEAWAARSLEFTRGNRLIIVGGSVGGSCALEVAALAPERIAALVLIGTKARHSPEPEFHVSALKLLREEGLDAAWMNYWLPLLSPSASKQAVENAKSIALSQSPQDIARGISVFHTRPSRDHVLASIDCPVLVVTGEDDPAPGIETCSRQAAQARHGRLQVIGKCGHYVSMEQPGQLNRLLQMLIDELQVDESGPSRHP